MSENNPNDPPPTAGPAPLPAPGVGPIPLVPRSDDTATVARLLVILAVVLSILAAVVTLLVSTRVSSNDRRASRQPTYLLNPGAQAAETAAINETRATLTYNYKTLASDFARAEKGLSAAFKPSYVNTTTHSVAPLATKLKAVSTATVTAAGVSSSTPTTASVLLFVDQTDENTNLAAPRLDRSRIKVAMVNVNGHWLINGLSPI